jgi:hypothetical protein
LRADRGLDTVIGEGGVKVSGGQIGERRTTHPRLAAGG